MHNVLFPVDDLFMVSNHKIRTSDIVDVIWSLNAVITDLDDTIAPSPAKKYVMRRMIDPITWGWAIRAFKHRGEEGAESKFWEEYTDRFLLADDRSYISKTKPLTQLFNGVKETFESLPQGMSKHLYTRNIKEITKPYEKILGITSAEYKVKDKLAMQEAKFGVSETFLLFGDSKEDYELAKKAILSIGIAKDLECAEEKLKNFDVVIGQNWASLAHVLHYEGKDRK